MKRSLRLAGYILAQMALFGVVPAAYAATLHVSNRGVDGLSCGPAANRCRSITRAIANAAPGDTIMVGPGVYGDLDRDGLLGETGEELGSPGCGCMLSINKPLVILSSDGAAATVINATSVDVNTNVLIIASGVEFGRPNRGFTVTQTGKDFGDGIVVDGTNVKIRGNQVLALPFVFVGTPAQQGGFGIATVSNDGETILIESNQATGWFTGIEAVSARKTVSKNHVSGNGTGIRADGGSGANGAISLVGNVVTGNLTGVLVSGAIGVVGNAIHGHRDVGVLVQDDFSGAIAKNNIFGNGVVVDNCGLQNGGVSGLIAANNYWGAASGPGFDPADDVCGEATTTTPFATAPFGINPELEP